MFTYILRTVVSAVIASGLVSFFFVIRPERKDERRRARFHAEYEAKHRHPSNYR